MPQTNDKNKQQPVQGAPDEIKCKCGKVLPPRSQCVKCGDFVIHTPIPPDPTLTKILEEAMDKTLQELDEIVFISSIDSITGKHKALRPKIEDREATIFIKGEFDRKDFIKTIIEPIFNLGKEVGMKDNNKKGEAYRRGFEAGEKEWCQAEREEVVDKVMGIIVGQSFSISEGLDGSQTAEVDLRGIKSALSSLTKKS